MGIGDLSNIQPVKARLYILQHGGAVSKDEDPDRPLSAEGRLDIQRLARQVDGGGLGGDVDIRRILHSGKLRAEQTALIIAGSLESTVNPELCSSLKPNDNADEFIEGQGLIQNMAAGNILIVSHMPFVSKLCSTLLTGSAEVEFDFTPGTLVCLFYEYEEWSMECMIRPETY